MKPFDTMGRDELLRALEMFAKNWLAHDGCWFLAAEERFGMETAIELDACSWARFAAVEARRIMATFDIPPDGGLPALEKALRLRLYSVVNAQRVEWSEDRQRLRFFMDECRVQQARQRKGLPPFPCKQVGYGRIRDIREGRRSPYFDFLSALSAGFTRRQVLRLGIHAAAIDGKMATRVATNPSVRPGARPKEASNVPGHSSSSRSGRTATSATRRRQRGGKRTGAPTPQEPKTEDDCDNDREPRNPRGPPARYRARVDQHPAAVLAHVRIQDFLVGFARRDPFGDLDPHLDCDLALVSGYRFGVAAWGQNRIFDPLDPGLLFVRRFGCSRKREDSSQCHTQKYGACGRSPMCMGDNHENTPK